MNEIPEEARNPEVISMLQEISYMHLIGWRETTCQDISKEDLTENICCFAIRRDAQNYDTIPEDMKTDNCKVAYILRLYENSPHRFNNAGRFCASPSLETKENILNFLEKNSTNKYNLICLLLQQEKIIDDNFVEKLVNLVSPDKRTEELYMLAVKSGYKLSNVPYNMRTEQVCRLAQENGTYSINDIPYDVRTESIYIDWLNKDEKAFLYQIPTNILSKNICMQALTSTIGKPSGGPSFIPRRTSLQDVPYQFIDTDVCIQGCRNKMEDIVFVPQNIQDSVDFWIHLLRKPNVFSYLPDKYQVPALHYTALVLDPRAFFFIHEKYKTAEMCRDICLVKNQKAGEAVIRGMVYLQHIPERLLPETEDIFCFAAKTEKDVLTKIPSLAKTKNVCIEAVKKEKDAIKDVPDNLKETVETFIRQERERQMQIANTPITPQTLQELVADLVRIKPDRQSYHHNLKGHSIDTKTQPIDF